MEPDRLRFELEIERDRQPIEGCLTDQDGNTTPFTGWLELMALLEKPHADHSDRPPIQLQPQVADQTADRSVPATSKLRETPPLDRRRLAARVEPR